MTIDTVCGTCGQDTLGQHNGCTRCPQCGGVKSASALRCYACAWPGREPRTTRTVGPMSEPAVAEVVPARRSRIAFRVYCFSCGRAEDVDVAPRAPGRCISCGGSMLVELRD